MEQLCVPLPPWSLRAGARETIWFNPAEVNAASESAGGADVLGKPATPADLWDGLCYPGAAVDLLFRGLELLA